MKRVTHVDVDGRKRLVAVPDYATEADAYMGIVIGPPDLAPLELPAHIEVAVNNQLFARGIITAADAKARMGEITTAISSACKLDAHRILNLYIGLTPDGDSPTNA